MDRRTLDRAVPLVYAALMVASALFFRVALAPIAIFGAFMMAIYYSVLRPKLTFLAGDTSRDDRGEAPRTFHE